MLATEALPETDQYRVEVSGWDENEMFFVGKSDLAWHDLPGKHVSLEHMPPDGAIVFVRMLQPAAPRQAPPIAYQVELIGCDPQGCHQFRLNSVRPRYNRELPGLNWKMLLFHFGTMAHFEIPSPPRRHAFQTSAIFATR